MWFSGNLSVPKIPPIKLGQPGGRRLGVWRCGEMPVERSPELLREQLKSPVTSCYLGPTTEITQPVHFKSQVILTLKGTSNCSARLCSIDQTFVILCHEIFSSYLYLLASFYWASWQEWSSSSHLCCASRRHIYAIGKCQYYHSVRLY
jgi:hypothetical protein